MCYLFYIIRFWANMALAEDCIIDQAFNLAGFICMNVQCAFDIVGAGRLGSVHKKQENWFKKDSREVKMW